MTLDTVFRVWMIQYFSLNFPIMNWTPKWPYWIWVSIMSWRTNGWNRDIRYGNLNPTVSSRFVIGVRIRCTPSSSITKLNFPNCLSLFTLESVWMILIKLISAFLNSAIDRYNVLGLRWPWPLLFLFKFSQKRWIQPITRTWTPYDVNRQVNQFGASVAFKFIVVFFFSLSISLSLNSSFLLGQCSSGSFSQVGPSHHFDSNNSFGLHPRDGNSAGFIWPGTCRHEVSLVIWRILFTRFPTNVPQLSFRLIHAMAVVESLQKCIGSFSNANAVTIPFASREPIKHASNSSLGIVGFPIGDTLLFACNNRTLTSPRLSVLRYTTAAYASWLASTNLWIYWLVAFVIRHICGILIFSRKWAFVHHCRNWSLQSDGNSESQDILSSQAFCNIIFGFSNAGQVYPIGSKNRCRVGAMFRFVSFSGISMLGNFM